MMLADSEDVQVDVASVLVRAVVRESLPRVLMTMRMSGHVGAAANRRVVVVVSHHVKA
jgi:hypothetical protein